MTLRLYLPASLAAGIDFAFAYPVIARLCWLPSLAFAEWRFNARAVATLPPGTRRRG